MTNTLVNYIRNNSRFKYVDLDSAHPIGTILDERDCFRGLLGCGIIIAREDNLNVVKNLRGDTLKFTDQEINAYYTVSYSSMTDEEKRRVFRY